MTTGDQIGIIGDHAHVEGGIHYHDHTGKPVDDVDAAWAEYDGELQERLDEPIFDEDFGIGAVYVPLRAYYEKAPDRGRAPSKKIERHVVDLGDELKEWVNNPNPRDAIRCVLGGPGAGKSSFATVFAADMSRSTDTRVMLIPLRHFPVDTSEDLMESMAKYLKTRVLSDHNPLDPKSRPNRLLIVFDGLDELSTTKGRYEEGQASIFRAYVDRALQSLNSRSRTRLQVLITSRDLFTYREDSENDPRENEFHLLPYHVEQNWNSDYMYIDSADLLKNDQRQQWWENYCAVTNHGSAAPTDMPREITDGELSKLTAEPLLMYLVAWIHSSDNTAFSGVQDRNDVYRRIVEEVYDRRWAKLGIHEKGTHGSLQHVKFDEFRHVLECIGLAAWHGDGRQTTVAQAEPFCGKELLQRWVENVQQDREKGIIRLLVSFFFKSTGPVLDPNQPFEFTHKSFGEYLTARRIVNELADASEKMDEAKEEDRKKERDDALISWAKLCGPAPINRDLLKWIRDEISLRNQKNPGAAAEWQEYLVGLIGYLLREGMPMHGLVPRFHFPTEVKMARNAEETLLAVLNACARVSEQSSQVAWPSETSFGNWISRLRGQRRGEEHSLCLNCLSRLDLYGQTLSGQDLAQSDLEGSNLHLASLHATNLQRANLRGVCLEKAILERVNAYMAYLEGAELQGAYLPGANLQGANLRGAQFSGATLQMANLQGAFLEWAEFQGACLPMANLRDAQLRGADFEKAELERAVFHDARLQRVRLKGSNLRDVDFVNAYCPGANFQGADLQGASFREAHLSSTDLQGANLERADLYGANLQGAHLRGANLKGANLRNTRYLTQKQLDEACGDENTKLPDGLTIKPCKQEKSDKKQED